MREFYSELIFFCLWSMLINVLMTRMPPYLGLANLIILDTDFLEYFSTICWSSSNFCHRRKRYHPVPEEQINPMNIPEYLVQQYEYSLSKKNTFFFCNLRNRRCVLNLFNAVKVEINVFLKFYLSTKTSWSSRVAYPCRRIRTVSRIPVYRNCARTNSGWKRFGCFWWFGLRHLPKKIYSTNNIQRTVKKYINTYYSFSLSRDVTYYLHTNLTKWGWASSSLLMRSLSEFCKTKGSELISYRLLEIVS